MAQEKIDVTRIFDQGFPLGQEARDKLFIITG